MYTQKVRLLNYLKKYSGITTFQAMNSLSILRLSERIRELQSDGIVIQKHIVDVNNQFGEKCRVMKYSLVK